ncbi:hypothetical protein BDR04DRAFT_1229243, partial [Suillus decipiens]
MRAIGRETEMFTSGYLHLIVKILSSALQFAWFLSTWIIGHGYLPHPLEQITLQWMASSKHFVLPKPSSPFTCMQRDRKIDANGRA